MQPDRFTVAAYWVAAAEQDLEAARELASLKIEIPAVVVDDVQALDKFYITPRYPDALGGSDIRTAFKTDEALSAIERAERVLAFADGAISAERGRPER